ncbi:hypothetical protein TNCV_3223311 [Trichonephila clavipes]|nr:hypothetical protein TNCV_3223311 [Trichonephila clavipes]
MESGRKMRRMIIFVLLYIQKYLDLREPGVQILSIRLKFEKKIVGKIDDIGNVFVETVDLGRQINLEVDSDSVQERLDSHNQNLIIDELIEMYEQEQDIRPSSVRGSSDGVKNLKEGSIEKKGCKF